MLRTNVRQSQTYDQIAIYINDSRLPNYKKNETVPIGNDGYDYGVFNFVELFSEALFGRQYANLSSKDQKHIISHTEHDISDHMPAWIRLEIPRVV